MIGPTESDMTEEVNMPRHSPWILAPALLFASIGPIWAQMQTPPDQSAAENVRQSQLYEQMLRSNPAFRAKRMQMECGSITDPELQSSCVASFQAYGPTPTSTKRQPK